MLRATKHAPAHLHPRRQATCAALPRIQLLQLLPPALHGCLRSVHLALQRIQALPG